MSTLTPLVSEFPLKPVKFMAPLRGDKVDSVPTDGEYLGLEQLESWSGKLSGVELQQPPEGSANVFDKGDVLFGKLRPYLAKGWVADRAGYCTTESLVLQPGGVDSRFVRYCLLTHEVVSAIDGSTYGSKMPRADWGFIGSVHLPCPSAPEQERIANFLDEKTTRIDALIAEKEQLRLRVSAYRVALIESAVAGKEESGGRSATPFDFCTEVPDGWLMRRLKHISPEIVVGIVVNPSDYYSYDGRPFVFGGDIREDGIKAETTRRISQEGNSANEKSRLRSGDLVTVRVGEPGVTAVVPKELDGANCASVMLTRGAPSFDSAWLAACMNSTIGRHQVKLVEYGAAMKQFNISHAREFWFPVPPLSQQNAIAAQVRAIDARTRELMSHTVEHIDRLREYRSSLISAAVTGQLDIGVAQVNI